MSETLSLAAVKARLSELVDRVVGQHDRVTITRNGKPAAVLVSPEDLDELEETLAIMSDPELMKRVHEGRKQARAGETVSLQDLKKEIASKKKPQA
jgi:prevent-host-death family protein